MVAQRAARPPGGMVRLDPSRGRSLTVILEGPPERSGGVGGWQSSERSGRKPGKWWLAPADDAMTLNVVLHVAHPKGSSLEARLRALRAMGRASNEGEPPTIRLHGDLDPHDRQLRWVLQEITLGDRKYDGDGTFFEHRLSIALEGFDEIPTIRQVSIRRTRDRNGHRRRREYGTRKGDTLRKIAVAELGSSSQWRQILEWNPKLKVRDPDKHLPVHTKLVLR
jgi:phage protein U